MTMYNTPNSFGARAVKNRMDRENMQILLDEGWQRTPDDCWINPDDNLVYQLPAAITLASRKRTRSNGRLISNKSL